MDEVDLEQRLLGKPTGVLVTRLLQEQRYPEHGYRACLGLLSLSFRYDRERLEAACAGAGTGRA